MNILFLSVSTGGGHIKAAEAIKEAIELKYPHSNNIVIDCLKYISPVINKLVVGSYLTAVRIKPELYGKIYKTSEAKENLYYFSKAINNLFSNKMKALIDEASPSVIVCTHPFPLHMLSMLKTKGIIDIPVAAVLTDYATHNFWIDECVDAYVVAHELMLKEMILRGIPAASVFPYGIPVSRCFLKKKCRRELLQELGLEDRKTILVMGGSLGLGCIEAVFKSLLAFHRNLQIIIITGNNEKLRSRLNTYIGVSDRSIKILSYTDRVNDYMDISDLLITKPGGVTIAEALVKGLPILTVSPIPGQEEENAGFLIRYGAALKIESMEKLHNAIVQLLSGNSKILHLKNASGKLARPNASADILHLLEELSLYGGLQLRLKNNDSTTYF